VNRDRTHLPRERTGADHIHPIESDVIEYAPDRQEANRKFRLVVDAATDAFVGMDQGGRITAWNSQAEKTFGWRDQEVLGLSLADTIIPCRNRESHRAGLARFLASGEAHILNERIEVNAIDRHGREFPVELTVWAVDDPTETISFNAFIHDISSRKRDEKERTSALSAALDASLAKSALLATMSHEIRTPMNGVVGMASLMLETDLDTVQRQYAVCLRDSGKNVVTLIDDLLDFSQIEAGKLELEEADFDLRDCVDSTSSLLSSQAQCKGIALRVDVAADVPMRLRGDSLRLRQVLINLIGNAIKFTEAGAVTLAVATVDHRLTRFSVSDTGIGVDPSAESTLLAPFVQAHRSSTRFGGTGLGLAICVQLVELMGGTLEFKSRLGRGTIFWFDIALASSAGPESTSEPEPEPELAVDVVPSEARVLLADDAEINRIVGVALLNHLGYSVDVVADGAEALAAVQRNHYDILLMDCVMPVMDGYEATACVRRLRGPARHIPIIAVTASALVGDREKCLKAGMDDYVSKPLDRAALAVTLARYRPRHSPMRPVPQAGDIDTSRPERADEIRAETLEGLRQLEITIGSIAYAAVCETFRRTYPTQICELYEAVSAGDVALTGRLAHKLKGAAASMGARRVSELAADLERPGQGPDRLGALVAEIDQELAQVDALLGRPAEVS